MKKRVAILHTSMVFINVEPILKNLFEEILPDVEVVDFIDSKVLADVNRDGRITKDSVDRMAHLAQAAEHSGADVIFSACSSLGPSIDFARQVVNLPIIKIDDAMARKAVEKGERVGVLATVPTTLTPTSDLIQEKAREAGKEIVIKQKLSEGAFDKLMSGQTEEYERTVRQAAEELAKEVDLIVLAQASMTRLAPMLSEATGLEVLTSPRLGVESIKEYLDHKA
jgi:Asp/Glu/hydantoin racemase